VRSFGTPAEWQAQGNVQYWTTPCAADQEMIKAVPVELQELAAQHFATA
jgi:hypothetical protein